MEYLFLAANADIIDTINNSTAIHEAIATEKPETYKYTSNTGDNDNIKSSDNNTVSDIVQFPNVVNSTNLSACHRIVSRIYKINQEEEVKEIRSKNKKSSEKVIGLRTANTSNQCNSKCENNRNIPHVFLKKRGTSGVSGQLYETKLLSLILLRALCDDNIKEFVLGTNIDGVGAFDDIVLRYETNEPQKHKIIFLQAKHKDDPSKNKVNVENIFKQNGDFSLIKYFESFLKIKQKFVIDKNNVMFIDSNKDIECEFIIYTSAQEQFTKKNILEYPHEQSLIKTSHHGKVFQFAYDSQDVEMLVSTVTKSRATHLAKSLSKFILKDNFDNIMAHDCIKIYHVYLAHNVITIEPTNSATEETYDYVGKFRDSFWTTKDDDLALMRHVICKEIAEMKGIVWLNQQNEIENVLKSFTFKLPINFGNHLFRFHGTEKKKQRRVEYMCSLLHKLLLSGLNNDSKHTVIKLDDDSVGSGKLVQSKDLENYRLAGLVGNLLLNDDEIEMFKFNLDEQSLSKDNIQIIRHLKEKYDLCKFRFDINIDSFPKLTLKCKERDRTLVMEFLNKLKFYTNQSKEDEVENVLKQEITKYLNMKQERIDFLFRVKCDAIYLKVHDKIQKWWQKPDSYLTKACKFYQQAKREILDSPLLNIIHFIYCEKPKNSLVDFNHEAIEALRLDRFLKSDERILFIVSDEINFSSKKVIQYFDKVEEKNDYIFLDLDFMIIENCFDIVMLEVECSAVSVLVLVSRGCIYGSIDKVNRITNVFKGQIIIITGGSTEDNLKITYSENNVLKDTTNNFSNLSSNLRKIILGQREVIFQGIKFNVDKVFNEKLLNLFSPNLLSKLIENEELVIGNTLINPSYNNTINYYINQSVCRYITLNKTFSYHNNIYPGKHHFNCLQIRKNDFIILRNESQNTFEATCEIKLEINSNVHWFIQLRDHSKNIWKQTHGSLQNLIQYIDRGTHPDFTLQLNTLKDIRERTVLISAEPGMGKSILLTHVAKNTKCAYPSLWILNINLLDTIDQFNEWREYKTNINLKEVMIFLYSIINKNYKNKFLLKEVYKLVRVNDNNEICLDDLHNDNLSKIDLSEIKLFTYFYNNNSLAVLFDGYDEICPDYANEVIQLLRILQTSNIAHLWITSRQYNVLEELESALQTFSFRLNALTKMEQKQFLQQFWSHKLGLDQKDNTFKLRTYVDNFYSVITTVLNDIEGKFLSLPLHLYMIAKIYQSTFEDYIVSNKINILSDEYVKEKADNNLITLYERFTNIKFFDIRFGAKKKFMNFKDPDIRKMIDSERKIFIENHKKLAACLLLDKHVVLCNHDLKDVYDFMKNVKSGEEKTGIVECIVSDKPEFVHLTFAEYFAVEYIFDKITAVDCTPVLWQYFVDNILTSNQKQKPKNRRIAMCGNGIRRFINSKLQKDQNFIKSNIKLIKRLFHILLAQDNNLSTTAIYVAVEEDLDHIALFLLESTKANVDKNNISTLIKYINRQCRGCYGYCVLCAAIGKRKSLLVQFILELVIDTDRSKLKDLFYCEDTQRFSPLLAALIDEEMTHVIMNSLQYDPTLIVDLFTLKHERGIVLTAAHFLGRHGLILKFCFKYLSKLTKEQLVKIFSVKDFVGQLPIHYAAKENDYDFFTAMHHLLGREEFKKLCTTADNSGFTPICTLNYDKLYFDRLKNVLEKVYEVSGVNVEDFVFNELPKLHPKRLPELEPGSYRAFRSLT